MRDYAFLAYLMLLFGLGLKRPFLFVLGYVYIDLVSPQRLSYYLLSAIPISLIFFVAAVAGWMIADDKREARFTFRQILLVVMLGWAGYATWAADFPIDAATKWDWVWKTLVFAIFLPLTLRTRLRMEALILFFILGIGSIVIIGGIKTLASGGGYGALNLGVSDNTGLYEGSIISAAAVATVPLILWVLRHGTLFRREWKLNLFAAALIFACVLIPIGTQARTGLICLGVLILFVIRDSKRKLSMIAGIAALGAIAVPLAPQSYWDRMRTIESYKGEQSASTRVAVWSWTLDFVSKRPLGGGFVAYRQNRVVYHTRKENGDVGALIVEQARAWHSSYFELLGELGYPGLALWLVLHLTGLFRMEVVRWRYRKAAEEEAWVPALAGALQAAHLMYLVGSLFVSMGFLSFAYIWMALEIALDGYSSVRGRAGQRPPWLRRAPARAAG